MGNVVCWQRKRRTWPSAPESSGGIKSTARKKKRRERT
ncbi:coiled-coil domain containing 34 [Phyllostomus discolor]|uniref:Coiled-coil domain containing 34 n=1 Tax=Phyllostomus discolor TaxID=89673 RepID=A0A834A3X8_9CHIR|nr:coiled-coil domain containing 34 [Phyllostomus discolor]